MFENINKEAKLYLSDSEISRIMTECRKRAMTEDFEGYVDAWISKADGKVCYINNVGGGIGLDKTANVWIGGVMTDVVAY